MSSSREDLPFENYKRRQSASTLDALLQYHQDYIYNICFQVLRHPEDAEDMAQEVLLEAAKWVSNFEAPRPFKVWLYRVAMNKSLDHRQARIRRVEFAKVLAAGFASEGAPMDADERSALMQAIGGLDDQTRCLLLEHYFDKLTMEEIGQREGISSMAVWKRLERAREHIRRALLGMGLAITGAGIAQGLESVSPVVAPVGLIGPALFAKVAIGTPAAMATTVGGATLGTMGGIAGASVVALMFVLGATAMQTVTLTSTADFERGNSEGLISTAQDRITRGRITAGTVGSWTATTALPTARILHSSVAHNGFIYVIGGTDGFVASMTEVSIAPINTDGTVGTWSTTTALPSIRGRHASVAYDGFLYVVGGEDENSNVVGDVFVAPLNTDGSVGAWSTTTALPSGRRHPASVAYNGFLYSIGGAPGPLADVLVAPINADGSIGGWTATTSLSSGRSLHTSLAYNGFIYVIGGTGPASDVFVAPLNADGSVGTWTTTTALPSGRSWHSSVAYDGFLYVFGGQPSPYLTDVLVAPINSDGSVGTWSASTALPSGRRILTSLAYNGYLYSIGGQDDSITNLVDVLYSPIDADIGNSNQTLNRLRGVYSHLVDLGSDTPTRSIILNGQTSPGGLIRLQVRVAPEATGIFGTDTILEPAPLGSPIQVAGSGRYVWLRLTLDDTSTSNVDQSTYVSDITVSPLAPPTAGVVNDGLGTDIDTQTSTTMIEANWNGFTPSGGDSIAFYEWAIGTAPGLTNVQDWTSVGLATSATNSSLSLTVGVKYVGVRATSAAGLTSQAATSDGVQVMLPPAPPSGGGGDDHKGRCGSGVPGGSGSWLAILAGLAILAPILRRR